MRSPSDLFPSQRRLARILAAGAQAIPDGRGFRIESHLCGSLWVSAQDYDLVAPAQDASKTAENASPAAFQDRPVLRSGPAQSSALAAFLAAAEGRAA